MIRYDDEAKDEAGNHTHNQYFCTVCREEGRDHKIEDVDRGFTDATSTWGAGVPKHVQKCTGCGAERGPWVKAEHVGAGY